MIFLYSLFLIETVSASVVKQANNYCEKLMCKSVLLGRDNSDNHNTLCAWDVHNFNHYKMMKEDAVCSWSKNSSFKYYVIKNQTGLVLFEFNYRPVNCKYTNVSTVELYVIENENDEILHSSVLHKNIKIENNTFSASFKYVFTGTYYIQINALKSPRIGIKTQYNVKKIDKNSVNSIVLPPNEHEMNKTLTVKINLNTSYFFNEPLEVMTLFMCKNREKDFLFYNHEAVSNICCTINSSCAYKRNTTIICFYENVEPGNYTFMLKINDHVRCNTCSVFCEEDDIYCCWFQRHIEINATLSEEKTEVGENGTFWSDFGTILIIVTVAIITVAIFVKCQKKCLRHHSGSNSTPLNKSAFDQDYSFSFDLKFFLLYARDAEVFMKMIARFKSLIRMDDTITVFDIYDYDEKNEDPMKWLEEKLIDDNIKIVLFLNDCASLVYRHQTNIYKEPHCFDHLFVHSLIFLINKRPKKSYENVFVTKLSCVDSDHCFNFLNPFVRYSMPQHIHKLLDDMCLIENEKIDISLLNDFKKSCIDCLKFYEKNNDYIYKILNVPNER